MRKLQSNTLIALVFISMLLLGFLESTRGALIPSIQRYFSIGYKEISAFLFVASLGYIAANFFGPALAKKIGHKWLYIVSVICIILGIVGMTQSTSYIVFLLFVIILNYGYGSMSIGSNTLTPVLFMKNQGIMMGLFHFFYGLGATIGPKYGGTVLERNWTWQNTYLMTIPAILLLFVFIFCIQFPNLKEENHERKLPLMEIIKDKRVILFSFILGFYVAAELGVSNWLTTYLQNEKGIEALSSANYLSIFFGIFTVGRLIGGFIAEKMGYYRSIVIFLATASVLFTLGILLSADFIIVISISGFFFSIIYPTVFALLLKEFESDAGIVMGVIVTISSTTNMLGNALIGQVNDLFGVTAGFSLIALFLLASLVLTMILKKNSKAINS